MNKLISAPGIVLFCCIPLRFLIEWMPIIGLPKVSTVFAGIQDITMLYCLVSMFIDKGVGHMPHLSRNVLVIFVIYTLYLINDIVISPKMPRVDIQRAPETDFELFQSSISIGLAMSLCWYSINKIDFIKWTKFSCLFLTFILIFYLTRVDIRLYAIENAVVAAQTGGEANMSVYGAIDSLRLGWFCGINYICNLFLKNRWTNTKWINSMLFWMISLFTIAICLLTIQRGPVVFIITTTLFYAYAKGAFQLKKLRIIIPILLLLLLLATPIYNAIESFAPDLVGKFGETLESGASGRFGSEDSAYSLAFKEFLMNPLFGHYFRYTEARGYFYGLYPHNILLESLMTMGVLFSIPFFWILWKCVKNSYYAIRDDAPVAVFGLIFIYIFSTLMTSASIVLMVSFWVPLAVISAYNPKTNSKHI